MNNKRILPKGRKNLPEEILRFGRHLVYSEGTKTEPYYIKNIKEKIADKYMVNQNDIEIIQGNEKSNNTIHLVNDAIKDVKKRLKAGEMINHVWVFFDKDDFPINHFNQANFVLNNLNDSEDLNYEGFKYNIKTDIVWHSCYSNEAFELWLCLYFDYIQSKLTRDQLIEHLNEVEQLKKISFEYEKNLENIHNILVENGGSLDRAINFAKKLENNGTDNPSTAVYKFMSYFKPYMKN